MAPFTETGPSRGGSRRSSMLFNGQSSEMFLRRRLSCGITIPNGPHPEEAARLRGRLEGWTQALTRSILRDASLRDAPQDEVRCWSPPQHASDAYRDCATGQSFSFCRGINRAHIELLDCPGP
jgi:hypothetical protein